MGTAVALGLFCLLMTLGVPVAISMLAASFAALYFVMGVPLTVVPTYFVSGINGFELLAVPFFILAAEIMNSGGVTKRIVDGAMALCGWMSGALAQVNIVASTIFAGISGAALADLAGLGRLEIKAMVEAGYSLKFSTALTLASSVLGGLIPPSIVMVIYAIAAGQSLGAMLLAGVVPGLLVAVSLMIYVVIAERLGLEYFPPKTVQPLRERATNLVASIPAIITPVIILSGIAFGIVTPTEAAIAACVYAILVSTLIYRELGWREWWESLRRTISSTSVIMLLIGASHVMSWIFTRDQTALAAGNWFAALDMPAWGKLLLVNVFLLIVGFFLEGVPALLILTPILVPTMQDIGVDPIHFGVILNFNLLLGILTPPVGVALFVASNMTGLSVGTLARAILPFFIPFGIALALITYIPEISLALPRLVMGY